MDGDLLVARPLLRKGTSRSRTASTDASEHQGEIDCNDMAAKVNQPRVEARFNDGAEPGEGSPTSPATGRRARAPSYADYLRSVQEVLANEEGGTGESGAGARPSPVLSGVSGVSPNLRGRASLGLLVSPSPLLHPELKPSPVQAVSCAFKPTAEELEEFTLDEPRAEVCRCCGSADVWVDVTCFADGSPACSCDANPRWSLCEACCELLVHDECLASQGSKVREQRGIPSPKQEEASVLPEGGEAFYEGLLEVQDDGWQPGAEFNPYAHVDPYQDHNWYAMNGGGPYGWNAGPMGMGLYPPVPQCLTVVDLQNMGADLSQICVEFAANGRCPRGPSCRWFHAKV